ncbi:MAG TPA: alpha/beta hydrolase [Pyrinomonadaceae bacterium]|jgi:pimeloyl-ACP methyl ester carboxylesterase|nr:alpha/beta hydrolase [Pyrinomonadaceae bacterium]
MKKRYWIAGAAMVAIAGKLLLRPRDADWNKCRDVVFHPEHSCFIDVDGVRVHYQEAGDVNAPAMVLIHGFASSTLVWSKVFLKLAAAGYRVIALDMLGHGYSAKPRNGEYTIDGQAKLLVRLLDRLGIPRAIFVGSSYGGAVAASCALDYPDRVEKLILVGAVHNNRPLTFTLMRLFGSPVFGDVVSPLLIGSRRLLRRRMKRVYDRHSWVLDERRVDARHLPLRASGTHRAIIRTVRCWDAERISKDAHLITQPALLIWGETDQEIPLADGERLHAEIQGSRLIVFLKCGHLPHEEYPEAFVDVVIDFCKAKSA